MKFRVDLHRKIILINLKKTQEIQFVNLDIFEFFAFSNFTIFKEREWFRWLTAYIVKN